MPEMPYKFYDMQQLSRCMNDAEIEAALTDLEVSTDLEERTAYLHRFMGTTHRLSLGDAPDDFTPEQEYALAKLQLLAINES